MARAREILVTGANGFIGSHLAEALLARGYRVRALVRRRSDLTFLPRGVQRHYGDITRPLTLAPALRGVYAVYHVAGIISSFRARAFMEVNAVGAGALAAVCRKVTPDLARFVLVSSLAAGGPSQGGAPTREDAPPRPVSLYGASKLAGERAVKAAAGPIPVTIIRPPVIYGPRDRGMLTFFEMAAEGFLPDFRPRKFYSLCHVDDLVRGILMAGEADVAKGRTYHIAEARAWSMTSLMSLIADAIGAPRRLIPVPDAILPFVAAVSDTLAPLLPRRPLPLGDKVRDLRPDFWIAGVCRARDELGFTTRIPLAEGLRAAARFYREAGWIPPSRECRSRV